MQLPAHIDRLLQRRMLPIVLCINILLLLSFLTFNYQQLLHADSAVKNLLAQEIYETGQYFPRDWNYVNNDLWVFYTHSFILPLLGWFPNGFNLHACSDLISASLILLASWLLTAMLEQSLTARLVSMVLVSSGMSLIFAEHVYGQAAYGSMYYMGAFLLYSYWRYSRAEGMQAWCWAGASALLAMLVFWANPQRALLYYGAPLLIAATTLHMLDQRHPVPATLSRLTTSKLRWITSGLLLLACVAGIALHSYYIRQVNNTEALSLNWLPFDRIVSNLLALIRGSLTLFEAVPRPEIKVVSLWGGYTVVRLLAGLAVLGLLPWAVLQSIQPQQRGRLFFAVFTLVALVGNLLIILTTSLADMASPEASVRYLVPTILGMLLLLSSVIVDQRGIKLSTRCIGIYTLIVLGTCAPMAYVKPFDQMMRWPLKESRWSNEFVRLGDFLEKQGLQYGYASFWSAGNVTVLSEQRVKVRQVLFEHGLPLPMRMLSSNRWYRPEAWRGRTFLAVQDNQPLDLPELYRRMGEPAQVLRFENTWYIYVFNHNLAQMPAWDEEARTARHYPIDANSQHLIGQLEQVSGQPAALSAQSEEYGPLLYGARPGVIAGHYLASFEVEASGTPQQFGSVEVCINGATSILARQDIQQTGRHTIKLRFNTKRKLDHVELRVLKLHGGQLKVYSVGVERDPGPDQAAGTAKNFGKIL